MQNSSFNISDEPTNFSVATFTFTNQTDLHGSVSPVLQNDWLNASGLISDNEFLNLTFSNNTNSSVNDTFYPLIRQPVYMVVVLTFVYGMVFICAILGNISVLCVVFKDRRFHSATYYLIANLAMADFLMAVVCQPITLMSNLFMGWQFGAFMCRATPYLQGVAVCASVNTLVVIAIDRYIAICHVMRQRNTKRMAKVILLFIWCLALLLMTPWALYFKTSEYRNNVQVFDLCYENFPEPIHQKAFFLGVIFLMCYAIPLFFIVACYSMIGYRVWHRDAPGITSSRGVIEKSKIRVIKMLVVVVLLFMFSWMPLYIIRLKVLFDHPGPETMMFINEVAVPFAQWLGTSNSCMNPLVYCLFSQKIRSRIRAMLCCSKPEMRSMYSSRYNSALKPSTSIRDSFKVDAFTNGYSRYGNYYGGSIHHHRSRSSRSETHRSPRLESEFIRLQRSNNNVRSTHV